MEETLSKNPIDEAKAEMGNPQERLTCDLNRLVEFRERERKTNHNQNPQRLYAKLSPLEMKIKSELMGNHEREIRSVFPATIQILNL